VVTLLLTRYLNVLLQPKPSAVDISRMDIKLQKGFTLIELFVALAVAAILLGIGIPSFSGAIKNSQISSDTNEITRALFLARSEAVKSNELVTVCPKQTIGSLQCGTDANDWKFGWLVFVDNEFALGELSATVNPEDEIISIHDKPKSDNTIEGMGSTDRTKLTASARTYIRYLPTGKSEWANGSFLLCNDDDAERSRAINIAPTGDIRPGRPSGSKYPRDVFNDEACQ